MIHLYLWARRSFHVLRQNTITLLTQSAEKWICMDKWARENWGILLLKDKKLPDDRAFLS